MSKKELKKTIVKRYAVFLVGLFINALGVSFITKASLGTSPISSIPYVLSLGFHPTLGQFTIYFSLLLIALQVVILGKRFRLISLLQIPVSIVFGYFIDGTMLLLTGLKPEQYLFKFVSLLIGCAILGFGVYLEITADVVMLPGESFVRALTARFDIDFGMTKVCFDAAMTIIAGIVSLCLFHRINGVREGTVIAALLVGLIARTFVKWLRPLSDRLF